MGRKKITSATALLLFLTLVYLLLLSNFFSFRHAFLITENLIIGSDKKAYRYHQRMPLIFIGGVPRSGTTLMRTMLDAHPDVRCGQETRIIPRILELRQEWLDSDVEVERLQEAGVTQEVINAAIASFCLEVIARHGEPASTLCNKDPYTMYYADYLVQLFPRAKFIFMVRDGRAVAYSILTREVTISNYNASNFQQALELWNTSIEVMYEQCQLVGPEVCMMVYYEKLVLDPAHWMRKILFFLDLTWDERVLHHEDYINIPGGAMLSKLEKSTDQVSKPVNLEALTKWVGQIPKFVEENIEEIAPMLAKLGYDPRGYSLKIRD